MVNWLVQTVRIFTRFSIQTIRTLNFIFVSALISICTIELSSAKNYLIPFDIYLPILRMRYLMDLLMEFGLDINMLICNQAEENL